MWHLTLWLQRTGRHSSWQLHDRLAAKTEPLDSKITVCTVGATCRMSCWPVRSLVLWCNMYHGYLSKGSGTISKSNHWEKKWSQNGSTPGAVLWYVTQLHPWHYFGVAFKGGAGVEPFWLHFFSQWCIGSWKCFLNVYLPKGIMRNVPMRHLSRKHCNILPHSLAGTTP